MSTSSWRFTRRRTTWPRRSARKETAGSRCATPPGSRPGCAASSAGGGFGAFTDTFEDLDGLPQLPGIAQRLMATGLVGAEGTGRRQCSSGSRRRCSTGSTAGRRSWRTTPTTLLPTAHRCSGHTLEVLSLLIAAARPSCEIHPLSIGGKADPVRLVFTAAPGPAVLVALLTSATASGSSSTRSSSSRLRRICHGCRLPGRSGGQTGLRRRHRGVAACRRPAPQCPSADRHRRCSRTSRR